MYLCKNDFLCVCSSWLDEAISAQKMNKSNKIKNPKFVIQLDLEDQCTCTTTRTKLFAKHLFDNGNGKLENGMHILYRITLHSISNKSQLLHKYLPNIAKKYIKKISGSQRRNLGGGRNLDSLPWLENVLDAKKTAIHLSSSPVTSFLFLCQYQRQYYLLTFLICQICQIFSLVK